MTKKRGDMVKGAASLETTKATNGSNGTGSHAAGPNGSTLQGPPERIKPAGRISAEARAGSDSKHGPDSKHHADTAVKHFVLDTNVIFLVSGNDQRDFLRSALPNATQPWKIAYGHHEYLSNGPHGNAGKYDLIPSNGNSVKSFVENEFCGKVDVYVCGHDHSLQDVGEVCGTTFLVSGAGSETTPFREAIPFAYEPNTLVWGEDTSPGFLLLEATSTTLTFTFFDQDGHELHSRSRHK